MQGIRCVCARTPDTAIFSGSHVGHIGPDYRKSFGPEFGSQLIDMVKLVWICFIGGGKFANAGIGFLQIDVDQGGHAAETETFTGRSGLDVGEKLSG